MSKEARISLKLDKDLKERLEGVVGVTSISQSKLLEFAIEAVCDYCEEHRELTVPFKVIPRTKYEELLGGGTGLGEMLFRPESTLPEGEGMPG
ncbi:MAG: hypothetical protein AAF191_08980 [Verrucomicrobiota bacterium]